MKEKPLIDLKLDVEFTPQDRQEHQEGQLAICDATTVLATVEPDLIDLQKRFRDWSPMAHRLAHLFKASPRLLAFVEKVSIPEPLGLPAHLRAEANEILAFARGEA